MGLGAAREFLVQALEALVVRNYRHWSTGQRRKV
jgi:hypothetical protein